MAESTEPGAPRHCAWCSATAAAEATHCPACGAALAQRESIGDLVIPGVTTVDPGLSAYAEQPTRMRGNSPSQGMASGVMAAATLGGPVALAAMGGMAAVVAAEYLGASQGHGAGSVPLDEVGRPSEAVMMALERLEHEAEVAEPPTEDLPPV